MNPKHKPAHNYSWPPFEDGNTASLVHGSYSDRAISDRAVEVHSGLLEHAPYLDEPDSFRLSTGTSRRLLGRVCYTTTSRQCATRRDQARCQAAHGNRRRQRHDYQRSWAAILG